MKRELKKIGRNAFASIEEMVVKLADESEESRRAIEEDALSIEVRSDWHSPGESADDAAEFRILLATGGPAVRIIGELNRGEPSKAMLEVQDWFQPWTEYPCSESTLLAYASVFYWGE